MNVVHELIGHEDWLTTVAYNTSGRLLITGSLDKTVRVWNADSANELVKYCGHTAPITAAQFIPNSPLAVSADQDGVVCTWNALDGTDSQKWRMADRIVGIGYIKQRDLILVATTNGVISFWDHQRARCMKEIPVSSSEIQSFRISPDAKLVGLTLSSRDIVLLSTDELLGGERPQPLSHIAAQAVAATSMDFSPDASRLVVAYDDASLRIIDPRSAQEVLQIQKGISMGSIVRFRPDAKEVLHLRTNRTMLQWKSQAEEGASESNRFKEWHKARAEWAENQFEHSSAFHHYSLLMEFEPNNQEHLRNRARSALFGGNFQRAIEDYTSLMENNPVTWDQIYLSRALLAAGDVNGYAQQCSRMKASIAKNRSLSTVNAYLWTCCLTQGLVEERQAGLKQFESLLSKSENAPKNLFTTHALACCREGRYQDAVQLAQKAILASADDDNPCSFIVLALATSKLQSGANDRSVIAVENNTLVSPKEYVEMLQKWYRDQQVRLSAGATPDALAIRFMNFELPLLMKEIKEIEVSN